MNFSAMLCESCHNLPVESIIASDEQEHPYRLCQDCAHRLLTFSLRPLEWFRLAAIYGPSQYYLSDDFYFDNGIAQAPQEPVLSPELLPFPALEQAAENLETLIDYAMAHHNLLLEEEIMDMLRQQNRQLLLASLQYRVANARSSEIEAQAYEICAVVLERSAEDWVRSRWEVYHPSAFLALAVASASCLPLDEGFQRVVEKLEALPQKEMRTACSVLAYFRTEKTLDWLETHVGSPITDSWGKLAAMSHLSWKRVALWLDRGRPLSLVALDALKACARYDTPLLKKFTPKLLEPAMKETMIAKLKQYAVIDSAPRVKQNITTINNSWESIL